jgi:glycosyltransferase involved in cell wall biosynthesis
MMRLVRASDLILQWFAFPSAAVIAARMAGKPALLVAGGFDVAAIPSIGYGQMLTLRTRFMAKLALRAAARVLCISQFSEKEVQRWAPGCHTEVVFLGLDPSRYHSTDVRTHRVVTVGTVSREYVERKGLRTFAATSRYLSDVPFLLVGRIVHDDIAATLRSAGGANLSLYGYLREADLLEIFASSHVYAQLSLHEGFGYALAEAMLSGCSPVATRCGALPEVAGPLAVFVPAEDPGRAAEAIRHALAKQNSSEYRQWIVENYSLEKRRTHLRRIIHEAMEDVA